MTREHAKQLLPIIEAYAEGKEIQVKDPLIWKSFDDITFARSPEYYRIKPEPRKFFIWIHVHGNGEYLSASFKNNTLECEKFINAGWTKISVTEDL